MDMLIGDYSNEQMFLLEPHFKEIFKDQYYFEKEKYGLRVLVVDISPYDYIDAVNLIKQSHSTCDKKLKSLKEAYDNGIKVPMPYLAYGERDENKASFGQEGYNRAYTSTMIGKETIPVTIRYREDDFFVPDFIRKAIDIKNLEHEAFFIGYHTSLEDESPTNISSLFNPEYKEFLIKNKINTHGSFSNEEEKADAEKLEAKLSFAFNQGIEAHKKRVVLNPFLEYKYYKFIEKEVIEKHGIEIPQTNKPNRLSYN